MATVLDVITGGLTESGALALGDTPAPEEAARGLVVFQAMWREAVERGVFGRVEEYIATANYTAEESQRVFSAGYTITLPTSITDADTGETRRPRDLSMIQVVNTSTDPQISLYDAHTSAWVRLDGLTLATDPCPLSGRIRHGLECALAYRLTGSIRSAPPESVAGYAAGLGAILTNRLSAPRTTPDVDFF